MNGIGVLIVDDNPMNLKLLETLLEGEGYEVRTAADADQGWERLEESAPRLILMDLQLPGVDGLELTRRIRADGRFGEAVIVAVTSYAMKEDREQALAAGCDAFVAKPVDTRELPAMLASLLAGKGGER